MTFVAHTCNNCHNGTLDCEGVCSNCKAAYDLRSVAKLVVFGEGGDTVEYGGGSRGSGYGRPSNPHAADPKTTIIPDGTIVLDKRPAVETKDGLSWVFRGPMVNVDLKEGEIERCPTPSYLLQEALKTNAYGALLAIHRSQQEHEVTSLDSVSIVDYCAGWVKVGARIGHYEGGEIIWHNDPRAERAARERAMVGPESVTPDGATQKELF